MPRKVFVLSLMFIFFLCGCRFESETPKKPTERGELAAHWTHSVSDGVPQRMSILRDRTEILTIGQHNHGPFLLLIRYRDDQKFTVYDQNGGTHEMIDIAKE